MKIRKPVFVLISLFIASFAIIGMLAFLSKDTTEKKNGFSRRLLSPSIKVLKTTSFPVRVGWLLGMQKGKLYFQGVSPYEVICTNSQLDSFSTIKLSVPPDPKLSSGFRMYLNGSQLYLSYPNIPKIIVCNLEKGTTDDYTMPKYYSKDANIATNQFIVRIKDRVSQSHRFAKFDLNKTDSVAEDHFSDNKIIGGFQTDGILNFDTTTKQACYSYYYQNGFICMDTNLNLTLRARTIDTITHREVKVVKVARSLTMSQPPQFVNLAGYVYSGKLLLQSMLKADNEYELDFTENSVIDIYSLKNGDYKGSFYIPAYKGKKAHQFQVIDQKLYALYGKTVVLYDLGFIGDL
ncbi:hypothetical protein [Niastella sp. OAS944]|uniref:hypothetical protein n=1 Tax=Niastella sp. OAS944 TaxID=2664089 RepID=UPI00348DAAE8|nr:hypothetical protein [Chitinophagaceae bacterium OAS944]